MPSFQAWLMVADYKDGEPALPRTGGWTKVAEELGDECAILLCEQNGGQLLHVVGTHF